MLAGRADEMQLIRGWLAESEGAAGPLHVIQIEGPIGIGKTALIAAAAAESGRRILASRGDPFRSQAPLHTHRALIETLLDEDLEDLLDGAPPRTLSLRCAEELGREPSILVMDDAQWLDPGSRAFLAELLQRPPRAPLAVILAHRPRDTSLQLLDSIRQWGARHDYLRLGPLAPTAAAEIVRGLPPAQRESALELGDGNPLFLRTLTAAFRLHPGAPSAADLLPHAARSPQSLLRAAVDAEVAALPAEARSVLLAVATLGRSLTPAEITQATGLGQSAAHAALTRLHEDGLLREGPLESGEETLHPLVRHTVRQGADPAARRAAHRGIAGLPGLDPFDRAEHTAHLGEELTAEEADLLVHVAETAVSTEPATVLRWLRAVPVRLRSPEIELLVARAQIHDGRIAEAVSGLRPLAEAEDPAPGARVLLGQALRMQGQLAEAREVLRDGLHDASSEEGTALLRELIALQALLDHRVDPGLLDRLARGPSAADRSAAEAFRAIDLLGRGHVESARPAAAAALPWMLAARPAELRDHLDALAAAVWSAYALDDFAAGVALGQRGLRIARRFGCGHVTANLGAGLSYCLINAGRLLEADAVAEQAVADAHRFGSQGVEGMALAAMAQSARWQRDDGLLRRRYEELCAVELPEAAWWRRTVLTARNRTAALLGVPTAHVFEADPPDATVGYRYCDAGTILAAEGELPAAAAVLEEGLEVTRMQGTEIQHALVATTLAELLIPSEPVRARALLDLAHEVFARLGMPAHLGRVRGGMARMQATEDPWADLTRREREIAQLVAEGLTNAQVAERLFISRRTAEEHVSKILRKLGVRSRSGIISRAGRRTEQQGDLGHDHG